MGRIREIACQLHDPDNDVSGIVLRGLPGWGQGMAVMTTVVNTFGGRWFDENWEPQLTSPEWNEAISFYINLVNDCGQPGPTSVGFVEALTIMSQGQARCGLMRLLPLASSLIQSIRNRR